ncbi:MULTISPECIES: Crp/Fnr family transcriptional regulator [unclassified Saccharicrinis]|uniref:Crp/Fnr family transcriptional regulator n=1 Tax=unclassified Saccharicrinis TaxID=2646859 RepID=UPI003D33D2A9
MSLTSTCIDCKIGSKCFRKLIPSELEFINQKKTQITYRKGENLCKQGAFASYVLYVSNGLVKLYLENKNNKFTNIKILKASDFIAIESIYGDNIYFYSAVALQETDVCLIDKNAIRKLLENNASFASEMIKRYCRQEKLCFNIIQSIGYKQMPGRLADTLLYLTADRFNNENVFKFITRKDIADFACISKESTIKLLTEFKNEGIIDIDGKNIEILKPDILRKISKLG